MNTTPFEDNKPAAEVADPPEVLSGAKLDEAIVAAIQKLDPEEPQYWTNDGYPQCNILTSMIRQRVSTEKRNEIWEGMLETTKAAAEAQEAAKLAPPAPTVEDKPVPVSGRAPKWGGLWAVLDTNAAAGAARIHHPMGMKAEPVSLRSDRVLEVSREIAAKFLNDPSFHVFNPMGDRVESLPDAELLVAGRSAAIELAPNEVVAKLSELSLEALLIRVNRMPGGEEFNESSNRMGIEDFYVQARQQIARGERSFSEDPVPQLEELDQSALARLMPAH